MEHRLSPRTKLNIAVALQSEHGDSLFCRTKDISTDGIYLYAAAPQLRRHALVKLVVADDPAEDEPVAYPAMVVRVDQSGLGLMFQETGEQLREALRHPSYWRAVKTVAGPVRFVADDCSNNDVG